MCVCVCVYVCALCVDVVCEYVRACAVCGVWRREMHVDLYTTFVYYVCFGVC